MNPLGPLASDWPRNCDPEPVDFDELIGSLTALVKWEVEVTSPAEGKAESGVAVNGLLERTRITGPDSYMFGVGETGLLQLDRSEFVTAERSAYDDGAFFEVEVHTHSATFKIQNP